MKEDYTALHLAAPLMPGEYRFLADGRYRVCCQDCESILTVHSLVSLPEHGCTERHFQLKAARKP